jgi:hypothetical protein
VRGGLHVYAYALALKLTGVDVKKLMPTPYAQQQRFPRPPL